MAIGYLDGSFSGILAFQHYCKQLLKTYFKVLFSYMVFVFYCLCPWTFLAYLQKKKNKDFITNMFFLRNNVNLCFEELGLTNPTEKNWLSIL